MKFLSNVAGGGKTTTLINECKALKGRTLLCCFNKSVADELSVRVPSNTQVSTLHSIGKNLLNPCRVNQWKNYLLIDEVVPELSNRKDKKILKERVILSKIISLVKNYSGDDYKALFDHFMVDGGKYVRYIPRILEKNIETYQKSRMIDFDDMILLPSVLGKKITGYDNILIDEAQDLNELQMNLIPNDVNLIAVGDRRQAIYAFRGADSNAVDKLIRKFNLEETHSNISYRCPISHCSLFGMTPRENAPEGIIEKTSLERSISELDLGSTLVLARKNSVLITTALEYLKMGITVDVSSFELSNLKDMVNSGEEIKGTGDLPDLARELRRLNINFNKLSGGVLKLSTVHKAKGLQAENVIILKPDDFPLIWKNQMAWEFTQEMNIKYVAYTRSKNLIREVTYEKV